MNKGSKIFLQLLSEYENIDYKVLDLNKHKPYVDIIKEVIQWDNYPLLIKDGVFVADLTILLNMKEFNIDKQIFETNQSYN